MTDRLQVFWDQRFSQHEPPPGAFSLPPAPGLAVNEPHPDRPERVVNIRSLLDAELGDHASFVDVSPATEAAIERVHDPAYRERIADSSSDGGERLTPTTATTPETYEVSRLAAGAAVGATAAAVEGTDDVQYALVRPSGHHAQSAQADGFCFLNNAAIAAAHVLETTSTSSVAIFDWDVHHGNGTQEIFYDRDDVLLIDLHNDHGSWDEVAHPQTGRPDEHGTGSGTDHTVNVPLPYGTGDEGYRYAVETIVEPVLAAYEPDLLLCSAGQDAGTMDPLGRNVVTGAGFHFLGETARRLARSHAGGSLCLVQEGGYQISTAPQDTVAMLAGALGRDTADYSSAATMWPNANSELAKRRIDQTVETLREYWDL